MRACRVLFCYLYFIRYLNSLMNLADINVALELQRVAMAR